MPTANFTIHWHEPNPYQFCSANFNIPGPADFRTTSVTVPFADRPYVLEQLKMEYGI